MATDFEIYMAANMPKRSALETYESVSYDGDPNDALAPAALKSAPKGTWFLQQTVSIYWRKKSSAADSWVVAEPNETFDEIDLYVRAADGDDSNPGSSSLPFETIDAAEAIIPYYINHAIRIHVGPHIGSGYTIPRFRPRILNANIWVIGDGGGGITDGFTEIIGSTAALAGSTSQLVKTTGLSTTEFNGFGEHFGRTIEILTGAAAGDRRTIRNNTATDIRVSIPFSATIGTGDTYRILEPEAIMYHIPPFSRVFDNNGFSEITGRKQEPSNKINFVNFKINSNAFRPFIEVANSSVSFFGVDFVKGALFSGNNSSISSGVEYINYPTYTCPSTVTDLGATSETSWAGWGLCNRGVGSGDWILCKGVNLVGSVNVRAISVMGAEIILWACSVFGNLGITVGYNGEINIYGGAFTDTVIGNSSASVAIYVYDGGLCNFTSFSSGGIVINAAEGIQSAWSAKCFLQSYAANAIKIETSGIGMKTFLLGRIELDGNLPNMICGGGDFSMDDGSTTHDISELTSGAIFASVAHGLITR